jgi:ribosomal 50S subunit-recycling heat shock protein
VAEEACRLDVWLWRARFFKTRTLAAQLVSRGSVRLTRGGIQERAIKPAKTVRTGDELLVVVAGCVRLVRIEALGERRGPPKEARGLYSILEIS